jgi:hypothetical protein
MGDTGHARSRQGAPLIYDLHTLAAKASDRMGGTAEDNAFVDGGEKKWRAMAGAYQCSAVACASQSSEALRQLDGGSARQARHRGRVFDQRVAAEKNAP